MTSILHALSIISKEAKDDPSRRYIAKSKANGGGKCWWVYDQKEGKFLRLHEIEKLSVSEIREQM